MMRGLILVWVGLVVVAVAVADDRMAGRVGKLREERSRLLDKLRKIDAKIAVEQGKCPHPAEQQWIDRHIYIGDDFVCDVCGERRSTWPSQLTFENGHYRPTTKLEFAAAKAYLERVEAADSRRLRNEAPSPTAPLPRETPGRGETGSELGGGS